MELEDDPVAEHMLSGDEEHRAGYPLRRVRRPQRTLRLDPDLRGLG